MSLHDMPDHTTAGSGLTTQASSLAVAVQMHNCIEAGLGFKKTCW